MGLLLFGADEAFEEGAIDGLLLGSREPERPRRHASYEREDAGDRDSAVCGHRLILNPSEAVANGGLPRRQMTLPGHGRLTVIF